MTPESLKGFQKEFMEEMEAIMEKKNPDYSAGSSNALNDYFAAADKWGVSPLQAWAVLFTKHLHAIEKYVKTGSVCSEPIKGRMLDAANYLVLGAALIQELEKRESKNDVAL